MANAIFLISSHYTFMLLNKLFKLEKEFIIQQSRMIEQIPLYIVCPTLREVEGGDESVHIMDIPEFL